MLDPKEIRNNLRSVQDQIQEHAQKANRSFNDITLIAVSKLHPPEAVSSILESSHFDIGENYVQEALEKQEILRDPSIRWHLIGPLQSKKAKHVVGNFDLIHTVDRIKLADSLQSRVYSPDFQQSILLQVNISEEPQKAGVTPEQLQGLVEHILEYCSNLTIQGLMCMPPVFDQGEAARPYFAALRSLKEETEKRMQIKLPHLSMGMSGDFPQAIYEGATLVRIGSNIFGHRE